MDAAQLCGIKAIAGCALNFAKLRSITEKVSRHPTDPDRLPPVRSSAIPFGATKLKQFPYMELLDSRLARKHY